MRLTEIRKGLGLTKADLLFEIRKRNPKNRVSIHTLTKAEEGRGITYRKIVPIVQTINALGGTSYTREELDIVLLGEEDEPAFARTA